MHNVTVEKRSQRSLDPSIINKQILHIVKRALASNRKKQGWKYKATTKPDVQEIPDGYLYNLKMKFAREGKRSVKEDIELSQFEYIKKIIQDAGRSSGWYIPSSEISQDNSVVDIVDNVKTFAEPQSKGWDDKHFSHIYERDAQIRLVRSAVDAAIETQFANRFHCVLFGPPACAKTSILLAVEQWLGRDMVLKFDATSTTKAGAERILLESQKISPVLIVEEIEKTEENSLRWLLGVLDHRAEIRKTNYNVGNIRREVKMLCLATVNDIKKFNTVMDGALASRFAQKIYCPRPNRKVLESILNREIAKISGNTDWIKPAMDFCEKHKIDDPRQVISICLCGRNALLTGQYQTDLEATMKMEKEEN